MVSLPIYDTAGKQVGSYDLDFTEFADRISQQLLHDAVVMYQANQRQGSAKSKTRGEVAGSTQKMFRQKGTGRARAGSKRSGVRRGGGHIHAKQNRDWTKSMPRKAMRLATRMALRSKFESESVLILDDIQMTEPKTKTVVSALKALGLENTTVLLALCQYDQNVYKSVRNVLGVSVLPVTDINALEILRPKKLVITKSALDAFRGRCAQDKKAEVVVAVEEIAEVSEEIAE